MTNQLYPPPPVPPHPPLTTHSLHAIPLTAVSLFFCSNLQTRLQPVTRRLLRPGRLHVRIPLTARWRSSWWRAPTFWSRIWTWLHRTGRICAKHLGFRVCSFRFPSIWEHLNLVSGGERGRRPRLPPCIFSCPKSSWEYQASPQLSALWAEEKQWMNSTIERAGNSQNPPLVCIAGLKEGEAGQEMKALLLFTCPDVEVTDGGTERPWRNAFPGCAASRRMETRTFLFHY